MNDNEQYIKRCFDLAKLASSQVGANPKVGAVIVKNDKIIAEGFHEYFGGPHAEANAFNCLKNKDLLKKATLYVSLEPCNHYGKTPPCVESVIKYKIPKVVISCIDPNPKTMGQSVEKMKRARIEVVTNILEEEGKILNAGFYSDIQRRRPFVILKYAQSSNNQFGVRGQQVWISSAFSKRLVHKWRSEVAAIMVGTNTLKTDNPRLDNRLYFGTSPVKVLLSRNGNFLTDAAALKSRGRTIIVTNRQVKGISAADHWKFDFDENLLKNMLNQLHEEGLNTLMVEGGARLISSFITQNLWDEARIFTGAKTINDRYALAAPTFNGHLVQTFALGVDKLEVFRNNGMGR